MVVVDVLDVLVAVAPVVVSVVAKHSTRNVTYQIVLRLKSKQKHIVSITFST